MAEGGVKVPFVWWQPGAVAAGATVDSLASLVDMLPTFVSLAGGSIPNRDSIDGADITPLTTGGTIGTRYCIPNLLPGNTWAIYKGRWKLVRNKLAWAEYLTARPDTIQLFDVVGDPYETTDVSGSHSALVAELQAIIDAQSVIASDTVYMANPREDPEGWIDFPAWGQPKMYYDEDYYWFRSFR
jgi:arylsulfatase A-like enzyme